MKKIIVNKDSAPKKSPKTAQGTPLETFLPIDWTAQWEAHAYNFSSGRMTVDLTDFGHESRGTPSVIYMAAGPGFGDLSHPTTRATLRLMVDLEPNGFVIDIGSGSGILSIASIALGAIGAHGFDIDPSAILHATDNALLNKVENKVSFSAPGTQYTLPTVAPLLIVMNMITSEQRVAWTQVPQLHYREADIITSGVLVEERALYLGECKKRGWTFVEEREEEGWLAIRWRAHPMTRPNNYHDQPQKR